MLHQVQNCAQCSIDRGGTFTDGRFDLEPDQADVVVRIQGSSVLWHKEALLNVALDHVPATAEYVAWCDCDVIFGDEQWPQRAIEALRERKLVQLFTGCMTWAETRT